MRRLLLLTSHYSLLTVVLTACLSPLRYHAPAAGGTAPISRAVRAGDFVFTSGQVGSVPGTGRLAGGGIAGETRQAMENVRAALAAAGSSLDRVAKCTVFLADIREWEAMNVVYAAYFPRHKPARTALQVAALPLGARVEIECVALAR